MLTLRGHNLLDYLFGASIIAAPYIADFAEVTLARDVFVVVGAAWICYSLLTDYFYSMSKVIPFSMHMSFDAISGAFIVLAPYIYGYRDEITGPQMTLHLGTGLASIALVAFTRREIEPPAAVQDRVREDTYKKAA